VVATGLIGMVTMLLSGMNERRREMAILRSVGARPGRIFSLFIAEATLVAGIGAILGTVLLYAGLFVAQPAIEDAYGLFLEVGPPTRIEIIYLGAVVVAGVIAGLIPALRALRLSLADGMIVRS